jgi:hypothetical protein
MATGKKDTAWRRSRSQTDPPQRVAQSGTAAKAGQAMGTRYEDLKWQAIVPDLGADSPQVSILRVDPATQATELMIRIPKQMHHQAWSSDDSLVFITVDAAWDVNWVNGPPTKAHLGKTPGVR